MLSWSSSVCVLISRCFGSAAGGLTDNTNPTSQLGGSVAKKRLMFAVALAASAPCWGGLTGHVDLPSSPCGNDSPGGGGNALAGGIGHSVPSSDLLGLIKSSRSNLGVGADVFDTNTFIGSMPGISSSSPCEPRVEPGEEQLSSKVSVPDADDDGAAEDAPVDGASGSVPALLGCNEVDDWCFTGNFRFAFALREREGVGKFSKVRFCSCGAWRLSELDSLTTARAAFNGARVDNTADGDLPAPIDTSSDEDKPGRVAGTGNPESGETAGAVGSVLAAADVAMGNPAKPIPPTGGVQLAAAYATAATWAAA